MCCSVSPQDHGNIVRSSSSVQVSKLLWKKRYELIRGKFKGNTHCVTKVRLGPLSALLNLGYSSRAAGKAVDKAISGLTDITLEKLITEALKVLA